MNALQIHLDKVVKAGNFNYRTFGVDIEQHVTEQLIVLFKDAGFIKKTTDYHIAEDKNEFPDFLLKIDPPLAIEIKTGNHYRLANGTWTDCKNSENDMGTLNKWPEKLKMFGGDNIYYLFVEYAFTDSEQKIVTIKFAPFYMFLGLNSDGTLKYREKDGNLRPKDFDVESPIKTLEQFNELIPKTIIYRSKRIIIKHLNNIPSAQRDAFLDSLKTNR